MMIAAAGLLAFTACGGNKGGNNEGQGGDQKEAVEQTEATASEEVKEGSKGPCTVSCDKFSIDIPEGWEVRVIKENEISAGQEYKEGLNFVYDEQANYKQSQQIEMDINGMEDLGEKTLGNNTYATFLWKQDAGDSFSAILKIGDGENGIIKVNTTNVKTADNEVVLKVMESLKMK
jgi:hypothetical protein